MVCGILNAIFMPNLTKFTLMYPAQTIMDVDYADDIVFIADTHSLAESQLHSLEQAAEGIGLHVSADKTEYMLESKRRHFHTSG